jgi:hypothetical protein
VEKIEQKLTKTAELKAGATGRAAFSGRKPGIFLLV